MTLAEENVNILADKYRCNPSADNYGLVWDEISNAGGENAIQVDQEIRYARGAASKYKGALEQKRQNEDAEIQELLYQKIEIKKQKEFEMKIKKIKKYVIRFKDL
ncbi:hypothetical protein PR048_026543 [Dryococelus australis]|uniref:Uncharacterized protein n=1 Tax=Dryococelus australis TaxID=614101 RepID=A0ABQ9GLL5_9NEOP|nr:hypothetical protein PR048_026543 [Dryococelus australis]